MGVGGGFFCNLWSFKSHTAKHQTLVVLHVPRGQRTVTAPWPRSLWEAGSLVSDERHFQGPALILQTTSASAGCMRNKVSKCWGLEPFPRCCRVNLWPRDSSVPAEESAALRMWWETLPQPSIHYSESQWWESALMGLAKAAQKLPKDRYLQLSSHKGPPWWQSIMVAALESLWFKRERATGLLLSLRRAVSWKLLHNLFPCLPRSPVARFPSGLLERAVRICTLKAGM